MILITPIWGKVTLLGSTRAQNLTILSSAIPEQESPLPLTDPRDAVTQRMLKIPHRIIW